MKQVKRRLYLRSKMFLKKKIKELGNMITWLIPNAQKNDMEPILINIDPGCKAMEQAPHEGEEFGYVLSGTHLYTPG